MQNRYICKTMELSIIIDRSHIVDFIIIRQVTIVYLEKEKDTQKIRLVF